MADPGALRKESFARLYGRPVCQTSVGQDLAAVL